MLISASLLAALSSCAQDPALKAELADLRAEMRALRENNHRLERRVESIEALQQVSGAPRATASASPNVAPARSEVPEAVPDLTVVKLKPKADPAPHIPTEVPVVEPSPEVLEALAQASSDASGDASALGDASSDAPSSGAPSSGGAAASGSAVDAEYDRGLEALRTGNVSGGVVKLLEFAEENPKHPRADNALYFAGVGQMGLEDYDAAARSFDRLLKQYPAGDAVVDALLKLAECRVRLNKPQEARALYGEVISHYPGTAAATQAESRLASLQ